MSIKPTTEELIAHVESQAKAETLKQQVMIKEFEIRARVAESKLKQYEENDKNAEIAKTTDYTQMSDEQIEKVQRDNTEYIEAARNKMQFINEDFDEAVPFFQKNLILLAGQTGDGKSTTVANLVRQVLQYPNPKTGKKRRVLVITNEEATEDVFNRVTCLSKGWDYRNHDKFTKEEVEIFNRSIKALAKSGMLTVIDKNYGGSINSTSTLEGICQIFENLIAKKDQDPFDVIIIDYFQNVMFSRNHPGAEAWRIQEFLGAKLNGYKDAYPAAIVLMAQVAPQDKDGKVPFKVRIEGRKSILNYATCCIEIVANKQERLTHWIIHKSRFNGSAGQKIDTGYDKGEYVKIDQEFIDRVKEWKAKAEMDSMNKKIGLTAPKAEENENE